MQFAGVKNKSITLDSGFNILSGKNECGKTTLCAFIKYVLYGFDDPKEKERFSPMDGSSAFGSLTVEKDGHTYRIERKQAARTQTVNIYNEENGEELNDWKKTAETPGEYFTAVPAALYSRSLYVSQQGGTHLDGGSTEAVSNLLISGDEAVNLKRAKHLLDLARKELKLKRGQGGLIYETENKLASLKNEKARGLALKNEYEGLMTELRKEETDIAVLSERLENAKESSRRSKLQKIRMYLDRLSEAETDMRAAALRKELLQKQYEHNGFLPDKEYEKSLIAAQNELEIYSEQVKNLENRINDAKKDSILSAPAGYDTYTKVQNKEDLSEKHSSLSNALKLCAVIAVSALTVSAVSLFAIILQTLGLLKTSTAMLSAFFAVSAITSVTSFILRLVYSKKLKRLTSAFMIDRSRDFDSTLAEFREYESKVSADAEYLLRSLDEALDAQNAAKENLTHLLGIWGRTDGRSAASELNVYFDAANACNLDIRTAQNKINVMHAYLEQFTQNEIENAKIAPVIAQTDSLTVTDEEIKELSRHLDAVKERKRASELALASNSAFAVDMEKNSYEIELCQSALDDYNESHDAIVLAYNMLEEAEKNIRKTVSPYLSKTASRYFSAVTNGRYEGLRLGSVMELSYTVSESQAQADSKFLSGGSLDLAWFTLRLALHKRLSENENIPLILDEAFVYFDDKRLKAILELLSDKAKDGTQILLFSASSRELSLMSDLPHKLITLQ